MPTTETQDYNGWKNRQTWNVALWLANDEPLYRAAVEYVKRRRAAGKKATYRRFADEQGLTGQRTPDNIAWTGSKLDYAALTADLEEMVP